MTDAEFDAWFKERLAVHAKEEHSFLVKLSLRGK
jgi:hypothetical protein